MQRLMHARPVRFMKPAYQLSINIEEAPEEGYTLFRSGLLKEGITSFAVSEVKAALTEKDLHIDYFHKPYLSEEDLDPLPGDVAVATHFARMHKHGASHLCMFLKYLLQSRYVYYDTPVTLDAVATVRTDNPDQSALVGYYRRLSFVPTPINTWGEGGTSMESTVRRILNACERGASSSIVRFSR